MIIMAITRWCTVSTITDGSSIPRSKILDSWTGVFLNITWDNLNHNSLGSQHLSLISWILLFWFHWLDYFNFACFMDLHDDQMNWQTNFKLVLCFGVITLIILIMLRWQRLLVLNLYIWLTLPSLHLSFCIFLYKKGGHVCLPSDRNLFAS